jgi:hypothetical protein
MSINRILFTLMALFLAAYSLWNGQNLEGIGWLVLIELDRVNQALLARTQQRRVGLAM